LKPKSHGFESQIRQGYICWWLGAKRSGCVMNVSPCGFKVKEFALKFSKYLINLGIIFNKKLKWDDQVSKVCSNVSFDLHRMWPMAKFIPKETRKKLVISIIVPKFLYSNEMGCLHEKFFIDFPSDSCCTHKISEHVFLDFSKKS
jgi:hypothetical protein